MVELPSCPVCSERRVRWNAVEADCDGCGHRWPIEQLTLDVGDDLVRLPTPLWSPLRRVREASARRLFEATGTARRTA